MFQEDLQPHSDQNDAAGTFGLGFIFCSKDIANLDTDNGEEKGRRADEANSCGNSFII